MKSANARSRNPENALAIDPVTLALPPSIVKMAPRPAGRVVSDGGNSCARFRIDLFR